MNEKLTRLLIVSVMCMCLLISFFPQRAYADTFSFYIGGELVFQIDYGSSPTKSDSSKQSNSKSQDYNSIIENIYQYETASDIDKVIEICKKYYDKNTITGVRNQIDWMDQLYISAVQEINSKLGLGDTLLIALLNHTDINTALMTSSYSLGDINRVIAKQISESKKGYVDIDTIAKATGLSTQEVKDIIGKIASGSVTEKTISAGKNSSQYTNRGPYLMNQALKQEKVFNYLSQEIERMSTDSDALELLYNDLGEGYVFIISCGVA